ncbi:MAG TPA: hypothetical protein VLJ68_13900, partial [Chitinophagaceae bacterium]|nr:hypothetical protein [Chitinophagaceae bacterium]
GDAVNIASRIQSIAQPGTIYISESTNHNVINKHDIESRFIKIETLKNVKEPVKIYQVVTSTSEALIPVAVAEPSSSRPPADRPNGKSIAVLPFANMSNDPEQEYFSDGMAEEILNSLAGIKDLKVAGRTSAFQFKGKNTDLREVGDKLGVNTVLEGSVRKQGNRLRITAQLINVADGFHLWSERYDRDMDDIFAIQDEIAMAITEKLKLTLLDKDREKIKKIHTQNAEAYDLYMKGRFYLARRGRFILTAIEYFEKCIASDPEFSLGYAGLADASFISSFYSLLPGNKVMDAAKQAAETAIRLDPTLCEPYASLGFYYTALIWDWKKGKECFERSLQLNPDYAFGHYIFGLYYYTWVMEDFENAEIHGKAAIKLEPLSSITYAIFALIEIAAQKYEEALQAANTGLELDASSFLCYRSRTLSLRGLKRYDEAIASAEHLIAITNRHPHAICDLKEIYADLGRAEEARLLMAELTQRSSNEFIDAVYMGLGSAYAGDLDMAFQYLDSALVEKDPMLVTLRSMHYSLPLEADPRYDQLMEKIGMPER